MLMKWITEHSKTRIAMKKLTYIIAIATSVLAMASCQKEQNVTNSDDLTVVSFSTSEIQTKTTFGDKTAEGKYPTLWTGNEKVGVAYNSGPVNKENITSSTDGKNASFEIAFAQDANATNHNFYVISPADAFLGMNKDGAKGNIQINASQTPGEGTCDPAAQVIAASHKSETFDTQINLAFSHVTAYGNLSIVLPEEAGAVSNISLTGSENIAGRFYYDFNGALSENSASFTISLLTNKVSDVFFACAPADLSGGKLDITVTTENGTYEKSIDLTGKTLKFESGKISKFTVNGFTKKESNEVYTLVTDASTLKIGDKIIIAAATADFAISTTQNTSNRDAASVTKKDNTIVNPGKDVQVFTLEAGTKSDTYAFNTGSGYIYTASSSANQLKTQQKNDDNGSWTISCTTEGVATIKTAGTYTRNNLKYNSQSKLFSCYKSGQDAVAIYSNGKVTGSVPTPPAIKAESTSVSLNHDDETNHYMKVTITGAEAENITCKVAENADGTGEVPAWLTANYPDKDGKLSYVAEANTSDAARTAYIILSASNADGATSLAIKVTQNGDGGTAEEKSETITLSNGVYKDVDQDNSTLTWSGTSCSFVQEKGTSNYKPNKTYISAPRWYQNNVITFKANAGYKITKVVINCVNGKKDNYKYVNALKNSTYSPAETTSATAPKSSTEVTITTAGDFTITMSAQSRISSVVVYYTE